MPENPTVNTLTADFVKVGPEGSRTIISGGDINTGVTSTDCLAVEVIRLAGTEVFTPTREDKQSIAATYSDGSTLRSQIQLSVKQLTLIVTSIAYLSNTNN